MLKNVFSSFRNSQFWETPASPKDQTSGHQPPDEKKLSIQPPFTDKLKDGMFSPCITFIPLLPKKKKKYN